MACWMESYKVLLFTGHYNDNVFFRTSDDVPLKYFVYATDDEDVYNAVPWYSSWGAIVSNLDFANTIEDFFVSHWIQKPWVQAHQIIYYNNAVFQEAYLAPTPIGFRYAPDKIFTESLPSNDRVWCYDASGNRVLVAGKIQSGYPQIELYGELGSSSFPPFPYVTGNAQYRKWYSAPTVIFRPTQNSAITKAKSLTVQAHSNSTSISLYGGSNTTPNLDGVVKFLNEFDPKPYYTGTPYPDLPPSEGDDEISDGTQDWSSDEVPDPPSLTEDATDTGFTRIYNPTLAQLQDFSRYMWTDTNIFNTVWSIIARYFEDPMDAFISLSILPIAIPNTTNPVEVKMLFLPTGKYMYAATQQFVTVELGSVNLSELWGSALDYAPNTKIDLFLPYIGTVPVDPDEVMGKTVKVTYKVDICTGCCVAIVSVKLTKSDGTDTWAPLYQLSGNCAIQIPFTGANMDRYVDAALKVATVALTAGAAGAAGAAASAASAAPTMAESTTAEASMTSHQMNFTAPITTGSVFQQQQASASQAAKYNHKATAMRGLSDGLGIVSGAKPQFQHSSPFTANSGYMSYRVPFFIIKSPRLVNPEQYGKYNGYPSLTFQQFSALEGYTEVQQVQLTNINATANELDEIQSLLKTGVIM